MSPVGIAGGWDSGDILYFGFLTQNRFEIRDPQDALLAIRKKQEELKQWILDDIEDDEPA